MRRARLIYGEPTPLLQGKMKRNKPVKAPMVSRESLAPEYLKGIGRIKLFVDIFYINGNPFFHTKSNNIGFISTQYLKSRSISDITKGLKIVLQKYQARPIQIEEIHCDPEFDKPKFKNAFPGMNFEINAKGEHLPVID